MISKLELKRQFVHFSCGVLIITGLWFNILTEYIMVVILFIGILVSILIRKWRIPIFSKIYDTLERDSEKKGLRGKGFVFYLVGSTLTIILFQKDIAMASIAILAVGDSVSRLAGPYGYLKHPWNSKKFIEGVIVGGIAASLAAMLFVTPIYAISAATLAMIIESLEININKFKVDDNLTIPLISGIVMQIISIL